VSVEDCNEVGVTVTSGDGLLFDFVRYAKAHPEERLWQQLRNWSGYTFLFGSTATAHDDYSRLEDTFYKTTKGPAA
jgi:hypothetical protein